MQLKWGLKLKKIWKRGCGLAIISFPSIPEISKLMARLSADSLSADSSTRRLLNSWSKELVWHSKRTFLAASLKVPVIKARAARLCLVNGKDNLIVRHVGRRGLELGVESRWTGSKREEGTNWEGWKSGWRPRIIFSRFSAVLGSFQRWFRAANLLKIRSWRWRINSNLFAVN